jgi:hypothetical protein
VPVPTLSIAQDSPQNLLSLPTEFGQSYQMQTSSELNDIRLDEGLPFSGNGETRVYPTAVVLPSLCYRVVRTLE